MKKYRVCPKIEAIYIYPNKNNKFKIILNFCITKNSQNNNKIPREQIVLSEINETIVLNKIADCGYGNRIYSMLSAFMVAKLTNSAFFIDWPLIDNYIDLKHIVSGSKDDFKSVFEYHQKLNNICDMSIEPPNIWLFNKTLNTSQGMTNVSLFDS